MPGRVPDLDSDQILADLIIDRRRMGRALTAVQMPRWMHDRFVVAGTPATTYQLSYIPYGINVLARTASGAATSVVFAEGTDYTVDYSTGVVTISATLAASDVLFVSYVTTGDLTAASGPVDNGLISDNFNRTNSSSLGTTSDGKTTWAETGGGTGTPPFWGITSNKANLNVLAGFAGTPATIATVDPGYADVTAQVTIQSTQSCGLVLRAASQTSHIYANQSQIWYFSGTTWNGIGTYSSSLAVGDVLKIVASGSSITAYKNGTSNGSFTSTYNQTVTKHGIGGELLNVQLDDFSVG